MSGELAATAAAWLAADPDPAARAELSGLLAAATAGDGAAADELTDRFAGRLAFGTAGLRGALGAGPNRMNRAVVRAATAGLARWLERRVPDAAGRGVVVGADARHGSADFAADTAGVLAAAGLRVHLLPLELPTPVLAFAVPYLGAAAGVMVTASHNPAGDNGYKVYLEDGAQLIPPADREIEAEIALVGPPDRIPVAGAGHRLVTPAGGVAAAYVGAVAALNPAPAGGPPLRVIYTPLHGVAGVTFRAALEEAGFPPARVVAAQAEPDPDFPTLGFPNPEEPGALDLAVAEARSAGADLILANDPDGDRLAAAVPDRGGDWRVLRGDELGVLLGQHVLDRTRGEPEPERRLVATTIVSSSMLARIAAAAGVRSAVTLTGFKWIVRAGGPDDRFVFGYEEALGYSVGSLVRDKDGIGAGLALLGLAVAARREGAGLLDRLADLEARHGVHRTDQVSVRLDSAGAAAGVLDRLRAEPPGRLAGAPLTEVVDLAAGYRGLPPTDGLLYRWPAGRVVVRPSGTEPKLKAYTEVVVPVAAGGLAAARRRADELAGALLAEVRRLVAR